jgi:RHS repeat-associated protein
MGSMTSDLNKDIASITYNHLKLPEKVVKTNGEYLKYIYDASGLKLRQLQYDAGNVLKKRSDYIGDLFEENDTLKFVNHVEGRIIPKGTEYQYHLKDHLGNVRMTFTTKHEEESAVATLETANLASESSEFQRVDNAKRVQSPLFDHTNGAAPGYAQRLNGTTNERYGLAKSLSVMPGDTINMEVFVKYIDTNTSNWTQALTNLASAIASNSPGVVVDGGAYASSNSTFNYVGLLNTSNSSGNGPKAYLNWLFFNRDYVFINGGFQRMSDQAKENGLDTVSHEKLAASFVASEPGYVYIYLSNENETPVDVFFDDFKVGHTNSPVIQMDDYYPFGLTFNSYSRGNSTPNDHKYNGKEEQTELDLGWLDYGLRMFDPSLARWMVIDAWSMKYNSWSPYNYAFNNPIRFSDFMGLGPEQKTGPTGMTETQVYSSDEVGKKETVTKVTQETRTKTTTVNDDGTKTSTFTRSVTTNTITKNNETGETVVKHGKTSTTTYSETTDSEGKIVNRNDPTTTVSKETSKNDPNMKNLNDWTSHISKFNSTNTETFNQASFSKGTQAMAAGAAANAVFVFPSGTVGYMSGGGGSGLIITLADGALSAPALGTAPAVAGAVGFVMGGPIRTFVHSASQGRIKDGNYLELRPPKPPQK